MLNFLIYSCVDYFLYFENPLIENWVIICQLNKKGVEIWPKVWQCNIFGKT